MVFTYCYYTKTATQKVDFPFLHAICCYQEKQWVTPTDVYFGAHGTNLYVICHAMERLETGAGVCTIYYVGTCQLCRKLQGKRKILREKKFTYQFCFVER